MKTENELRDAEHQSLAQELMDMALMARGTQKLFALIGKEVNLDLAALQSKMNKMTKAQRDAEEIKQLFDVVNDLTSKKREMEEELSLKEEMLIEAEAEREKLEAALKEQEEEAARILAEKETEQQKALADLKEELEKEKERLLAEREATLRQEMEEMLGKSEEEKQKLLAEREKREKELNEELEKLQRALKEAEELAEKAAQNEELNNEIERLKAELEESNKRVTELEDSQNDQKLTDLQEQVGKLYWVNRELIAQIKERDQQAKRLQGQFQSLKYEDLLKNMHIDTLDAKGREKDHQRDILLMTKKELEETNARLDRVTEEHEQEVGKLKDEVKMLKQTIEDKECEVGSTLCVLEDWKPKIERLNEKERENSRLRVDLDKRESSFIKLKEELTKEARKRELFVEKQKEVDVGIHKRTEFLREECDELKKKNQQIEFNLKNKEKQLEQCRLEAEDRQNESVHLRARIEDLEHYLNQSIALNNNGIGPRGLSPGYSPEGKTLTSGTRSTYISRSGGGLGGGSKNRVNFNDADWSESASSSNGF